MESALIGAEATLITISSGQLMVNSVGMITFSGEHPKRSIKPNIPIGVCKFFIGDILYKYKKGGLVVV